MDQHSQKHYYFRESQDKSTLPVAKDDKYVVVRDDVRGKVGVVISGVERELVATVYWFELRDATVAVKVVTEAVPTYAEENVEASCTDVSIVETGSNVTIELSRNADAPSFKVYLESFVYAMVVKVMSLMVGIIKEAGADSKEGSTEMFRFVDEDVVLTTEEFKYEDTTGADSVGFDATLKSEVPGYPDLDTRNKFGENVAFRVDMFDAAITWKAVTSGSPSFVGTITLA